MRFFSDVREKHASKLYICAIEIGRRCDIRESKHYFWHLKKDVKRWTEFFKFLNINFYNFTKFVQMFST